MTGRGTQGRALTRPCVPAPLNHYLLLVRSTLWLENQFSFPLTYDDRAIIGPVPGLDKMALAAAHNLLCLTMATGKPVAELLSGQIPHIDPQHYTLDRFGRASIDEPKQRPS